MIKKKRVTLFMFLVFIFSTSLFALSVFEASWGSAYTINNVNTFTDAGTDARGIRPGTFGSEYARLTKLADGRNHTGFIFTRAQTEVFLGHT